MIKRISIQSSRFTMRIILFICIRTIQENKRKFVIYDTHQKRKEEEKKNLKIGKVSI